MNLLLVAALWAVLYANGSVVKTVSLASVPRFGLSCLHLRTLAEEADAEGAYFRSFDMRTGWISVFNQDSTNFTATHEDSEMNAEVICVRP